jgi:hypothetical protein
MPRYSFEPPQPDYPAASLAHFASAALTYNFAKHLSSTLAISGWEACGLSEPAQEVPRDFHPILILPRDHKIG